MCILLNDILGYAFKIIELRYYYRYSARLSKTLEFFLMIFGKLLWYFQRSHRPILEQTAASELTAAVLYLPRRDADGGVMGVFLPTDTPIATPKMQSMLTKINMNADNFPNLEAKEKLGSIMNNQSLNWKLNVVPVFERKTLIYSYSTVIYSFPADHKSIGLIE